jgi:hypothetical protein
MRRQIFCSPVYGASLVKRYRWFAPKPRNYLHSIVANPFWSMEKKIGLLALSSLCLFPYSPLSDNAVRCIANPLARRSRAAR